MGVRPLSPLALCLLSLVEQPAPAACSLPCAIAFFLFWRQGGSSLLPLLNKWNFFNVGGPGIVELAVNVLQWQEVILLNCMKVDAGDKNPFGYQSSQGPQLD